MTELKVTVERKAIRHMYLRILRDKTIKVTAPRSVSESTIRRFVAERRPWIEKALQKMPDIPRYRYEEGEVHYFLGRPVRLHVEKGPEADCFISGGDAVLTLPRADADREGIIRRAWADALAGELHFFLTRWAPLMGVSYGPVRIRHMKSRWGTCNTATGALTFALNLSAKDPACIEYVVVHELNHRIEGPHSVRFHRLMDHWLPDWRERKKKLNESPVEFPT